MERSASFWTITTSASLSMRRAFAAALGPEADPPMTMILFLVHPANAGMSGYGV